MELADRSTILTKEELKKIAQEVLELLRPRELAIWQVREVLKFANEAIDWTKMK